MTKKQNEEIELAKRLLEALSLSGFSLESRDKPDVLATIDNHPIGIEVTEYHGDEGQNPSRGSNLRRAEKQISEDNHGQPYAMWGVVNPQPALVTRIKGKIQRAKSYEKDFHELWLLIAASVPQPGAVASTHIFPPMLNPNDLNNDSDSMLRDSPFTKAYLHLVMNNYLYEWSPSGKWHVLQSPNPQGPSFKEFKEILRDPEWFRDPVGKARVEMGKALGELRAAKQNKEMD